VTGAARTVVLALETSCDETSAAVVCDGRALLGHVILSQDAHAVFGGVVPEIAARAHLVAVDAVVDAALRQAGVKLRDVTVLAATAGPGLIGALLVGVTWAKAAAWAIGRPFVPVHHMEAHLFGTALEDPAAEPPFVALLVSGGHTMLLWVPAWGTYHLLGETRDDAAGEAFDKVAKLLDLGYPGGPRIEAQARLGDPAAYAFPRPMLVSNQTVSDADYYDFSFSGLKTAVATRVHERAHADRLQAETANLAASFQAAVIEVLVAKTMRAVRETGCHRVVLGGGVAASRALRQALAAALPQGGSLHVPSARLATDNAAMVASAATFHFHRGNTGSLDTTAQADLAFPGLIRRQSPAPRRRSR
jgi:N6-L-threonylcarbamoyladenine synthase